MDISRFLCCAEIAEACSQFELQTEGGVAIRKPSELLQQLPHSTTPQKISKTRLEDVEEDAHSGGLLSPPRSQRPRPGLLVRCTPWSGTNYAKASEVTGTRSVHMHRVEVYNPIKNHEGDDRVEVCNLIKDHEGDDPCREKEIGRADSHTVGNREEESEELMQDPLLFGHSDNPEEACSDAFGANVDADTLEAGWQVAREQPCVESQDHQLEAPGIHDAGQCIGAFAANGIAHANGGTLRERCSSSRSSASASERLEEWYIGDASADTASDHAHDGRLSDTVLSHAALGEQLSLEEPAPSDEHPGTCVDAADAAGGGGAFGKLVDDKLEERPTAKPARIISARCRTVPSKDEVAADEDIPPACGELVSLNTTLDSSLKEQAVDESIHFGFAAYYWKDGVAGYSEHDIAGLDDASDADCHAPGLGREFSEMQVTRVALPEDTESEEEVAHGAFTLPMMEVLRCVPSRNFGTLLRLWDGRCNSQQAARVAEDHP